MASLIKVDEMQANQAAIMKFNTGAFNETQEVPSSNGTVSWNPESSPVIVITNTGEPEPSEVTVDPAIPTVDGTYITVIYPHGAVLSFSASFDPLIDVPDPSGGAIHRVYYSRNGLWWDA